MTYFYKDHSFGDEVMDGYRSSAAFASGVVSKMEAKKCRKTILKLEKRFSASGSDDIDLFLEDVLKDNEKRMLIPLLIAIACGIVAYFWFSIFSIPAFIFFYYPMKLRRENKLIKEILEQRKVENFLSQ